MYVKQSVMTDHKSVYTCIWEYSLDHLLKLKGVLNKFDHASLLCNMEACIILTGVYF